MTQLINRRENEASQAPVEIDNRERLVRLGFFVAVVLILAIVTGFSPFLGVIGALVAIVMLHEFGHFITAKWAGMKVSEYFFGFGPRLWSIKKGETEYGIKAIPVGGYVRILGMNNLEQVDPADEPRTYRQKSFPRRISVAVAGSAMHFLLAFLLLVVIWTAVGYPRSTTQIGTVFGAGPKGGELSPAQKAGLKPGDEVLAVDGHVVHDWTAISPYIKSHADKPVDFIVQRGNRMLKLTAVPTKIVLEGNEGVAVGIGPKEVPYKVGLPVALWHAGADLGHDTWLTFGALGSVFSPGHVKDYASQLSGRGAVSGKEANRPVSVVGFVRVAGQAAQHGWLDLLILLVAINIFIGIFNMVPLLPLDGGHVAIAIYERIRSRKGRKYHADVAKLLPLTAAVVSVLLIFGAMTIYLDIVRPIANPFH
ncbi:MAG TPA: M50 family metallopeptidase [Acidimicrobiales bacterium]|jgi:membrane-associated protease RseP (regulator of RpoE activity)|nr:M50 family metallopeptidase [Acidimicrobiales bacterium]